LPTGVVFRRPIRDNPGGVRRVCSTVQKLRRGERDMRAGRLTATGALGLALVLGGGTAVTAAPATTSSQGTATAKQCPVKEIKKVWYGGTSKKCPNLPDQLDHLFYPGFQFTTAFKDKYLERTVFIQLRLKDEGFKPITIDGKYGNQTKNVVKRYQKAKHLTVDGKVGKQTWKALFGLGPA
jgi:hypothetical protein